MTAITAATLPLTASVTPITSVPAAATVEPQVAIDLPFPPAAIVSLGKADTTGIVQMYTARGALTDGPPTLAWENTTQNKVTTTMAGNLFSQATADRFRGLGAALLNQVSTTGQSFSQSVIQPNTGGTLSASALTAVQTNLRTHADNSINLTIKTASGATVTLSLASNGDGLSAQVDVSGGKLSDAELAAVGKLADGFQSAIDGLSAKPPTLKLDGLAQFDKSVLSSVDLTAQFKDADIQSLSFQADAKQRSVNVSSLQGDLNLNVDTSNSAILGTAAQQAKAMQAYLKQFAAAQARGQGDEQLMGMFKDAFTTLNSNLDSTATSSSPVLSKADHALLSGLADFSASVTQHSQTSNPMRISEVDAFAYQISQSTSATGSQANRVIAQKQDAKLTASYHESLAPGIKLALSTDKSTQNYTYYKIDDSLSSSSRIAYKKDELVDATLSHSSQQSSTALKYVLGQLQSSITTPKQNSGTSNVMSLLEAAWKQDQQAGFGNNGGGPAYQRAVDGIHAQVLAGMGWAQ
jgi:hypothetical protein